MPPHKTSIGAIVGGVVGGLAGVLGLGLCFFFARRRSQSRKLAALEKDDMFVKDPDEIRGDLSIIHQIVSKLLDTNADLELIPPKALCSA